MRPQLGIIAFVLALSAAARADIPASPTPLDGEAGVVAAVVTDAVTETKVCALATERTQNAEVRAFCRTTSADDERTALAGVQLAARLNAANISLTPSPRTPDLLASLDRYSGREFDRNFLLTEIGNNEVYANRLRYAIYVTTDRAVRAYENAAYSLITKHLDGAESVLRRVSESLP